jgi:hypothetical protein
MDAAAVPAATPGAPDLLPPARAGTGIGSTARAPRPLVRAGPDLRLGSRPLRAASGAVVGHVGTEHVVKED